MDKLRVDPANRLDILLSRITQRLAMECPDDLPLEIKVLELKMAALIRERKQLQEKCDKESDPKVRAVYWTRIAAIDNAIHNFNNQILVKKFH